MVLLKHTAPAVDAQFQEGHFVVNKTGKLFSKIPTDQAHEQNNASVKGEGGAVGLTENETALRRWIVGGPEVARLVQEFEGSLQHGSKSWFGRSDTFEHHEQTQSKQTAFLKDVKFLTLVVENYGNPFTEQSSDHIVLHSKDVVDPSVKKTIESVELLGKSQYESFVQERLVECSIPLSEPIKNKLPLVSCPSKKYHQSHRCR